MAHDNHDALRKMAEAAPLADILEIRLDVMERFDLHELIRSPPRPVIVTYRSKKEGGRGKADYGTSARYLMTAIKAGADFVDVEYSLPLNHRSRIFRDRGETGIIISRHCLYETPIEERSEERRVGKECRSRGAPDH